MYFELIGSLTPKKGKGQFIFRPGTQSTTSVADVDGLHSIPPLISTASSPSLNLEQLTVAAEEITRASCLQPPQTQAGGTGDPNSLPTSAPSSYLSPSVASESTSSAVTSISHVKRKVSPSVADSAASLKK